MVYCGKPSRGCQMCRTRRIKCDETKPTCLQCQKSRRTCPGYKDDFDLVFRNETKATERRARRGVNNKRPQEQITFQTEHPGFSSTLASSSNDSQALMSTNSPNGLPMSLLPREVLSVPIDQQAPCFFISSYVLTENHASRGYFDFLIPMMKAEKPDSHLAIAFSAVAMAALANRPNSRGTGLMQKAIGQYSKALKAINVALQDPVLQKSDQTLAAILMLGFYENVMNERTNALAWGSHIDGAVQLVKMRGKKQLRTKIGHSLFACVRTQMTIHCMTASKSPMLGIEWWSADSPNDDLSVFATRLCLNVAELRADINNSLASFPRTPEYFQRVLDLMRRSQVLDQEYVAWEERLPEDLRPRTVAWVDQIPGGDISKAEVCPGKVDMFDDIWIAHMWNHARISRLFIQGAIVRCAGWVCSPVDYRTTPEYATSARICVDMVSDIIASIPYHLGWRVGQSGALKAGDFTGFADGSDNFTSPKALGGFFCLFPLLSIMCADYVTDSQRTWAKGRLNFISEVMGLNQAKVLGSFQLRLPSMIIRRDTMVHSPPSAQIRAAAGLSGAIITPPPSAHSNSPTNSPSPIQQAIAVPNSSPPPPTHASYALSPLQQRELMQREQWEKERKSLLKKASNSQGDSVERLLANYLAV